MEVYHGVSRDIPRLLQRIVRWQLLCKLLGIVGIRTMTIDDLRAWCEEQPVDTEFYQHAQTMIAVLDHTARMRAVLLEQGCDCYIVLIMVCPDPNCGARIDEPAIYEAIYCKWCNTSWRRDALATTLVNLCTRCKLLALTPTIRSADPSKKWKRR